MNQQAYPLHWPPNWPRTKYPSSSQFKTTLQGAINNVSDSLRKFGTDSGKKLENVLVSSNVSLMEQKPADAGVAVYFTWDGLSTCIAVDRYLKVEENLQAIHHCIEAERVKLRHGGLNLVKATFRGYAALPPPQGKDWWDILGVSKTASEQEIREAYTSLAKQRHPDKGGSNEAMSELNAAFKNSGAK